MPSLIGLIFNQIQLSSIYINIYFVVFCVRYLYLCVTHSVSFTNSIYILIAKLYQYFFYKIYKPLLVATKMCNYFYSP